MVLCTTKYKIHPQVIFRNGEWTVKGDCWRMILTGFKQTILEATFIAGDKATWSSAHEKCMLHSTCRLKIDHLSIYKQLVECTSWYFVHCTHRRSCYLVASDKICLVYSLLYCAGTMIKPGLTLGCWDNAQVECVRRTGMKGFVSCFIFLMHVSLFQPISLLLTCWQIPLRSP